MNPVQAAANPFALMTNPEAIFAAMATSDRLLRLNSRMCRPLDKLPTPKPNDAELSASDKANEPTIEVDGADAAEGDASV